MRVIDGSVGEGGGQIVRSALALSAVLGTPVRIANVRAGRGKPGLLRQHLTGIRALTEICDARVDGARLGSTAVTFSPGPAKAGSYRFTIGSAGSATLVLQTVLLPLALADGPSTVVIDEAGTHNPASPPFHFLHDVYAPWLRKMGVGLTLTLDRWGFYPKGGGRIVAEITPPPSRSLVPLHLGARGAVQSRDVEERAPHVAWVRVQCEHATELFTAFPDRGVTFAQAQAACAAEADRWVLADVPVGEHLADQLLLPMALAGGGSFHTVEPSLHTTTHVHVIQRFLDMPIAISRGEGAAAWRVAVGVRHPAGMNPG